MTATRRWMKAMKTSAQGQAITTSEQFNSNSLSQYQELSVLILLTFSSGVILNFQILVRRSCKLFSPPTFYFSKFYNFYFTFSLGLKRSHKHIVRFHQHLLYGCSVENIATLTCLRNLMSFLLFRCFYILTV